MSVVFCSEQSLEFFKNLFWYIYCYFFVKDSKEYQDKIMKELSENYIMFLSNYPKLPDNVNAAFSLVHAEGVITALFYIFRKVRNLLVMQFRIIVHKLVYFYLFIINRLIK